MERFNTDFSSPVKWENSSVEEPGCLRQHIPALETTRELDGQVARQHKAKETNEEKQIPYTQYDLY